jgi:hypothetical protein
MKKEGMHMAARFAYALDEVHPVHGPDGCYRCKDMYDRVDVDGKWFYLTRKSEAYILLQPMMKTTKENGATRS